MSGLQLDSDYTAADVCTVRMWTPGQLADHIASGWHPAPDYLATDGPRWREQTINEFTNALARACVKETMQELDYLAPDMDAMRRLSGRSFDREEPE